MKDGEAWLKQTIDNAPSLPNLPCVDSFAGGREVIREIAARVFRQVSDRVQRKEIRGDSPNLSANSRLSIFKQDKVRGSYRPLARLTSPRNAGRGTFFAGVIFPLLRSSRG